MAEQVVDLLEAIEIDAQHREAAAAAAGVVEDLRKMGIERGAVRQIRQRIVPRQMQDALLRALAIGQIEGDGDAGVSIVVAQRARLDGDVDHSSVGRDVAAGFVRRLQSPVFTEVGL